MAQGISEGLLINRLSELSFKRMGHFLRGVRAEDLGHSLTALFYLAIDQALEHTAQSYAKLCTNTREYKLAQKQIRKLQKALRSYHHRATNLEDDQELYHLLQGEDGSSAHAPALQERLADYLSDPKLRKHVATCYPYYLQM